MRSCTFASNALKHYVDTASPRKSIRNIAAIESSICPAQKPWRLEIDVVDVFSVLCALLHCRLWFMGPGSRSSTISDDRIDFGIV